MRKRRRWYSFYFENNEDELRLEGVWHDVCNNKEFEGCFLIRTGGETFTNIPMYLLKRMARLDDLRLPDASEYDESEDVIQELLYPEGEKQ